MSPRPLSFELHVFAEPEDMVTPLKAVSSVRYALFVAGVPRCFIGRRYTADTTLTLLPRGGGEPLARFGSSGLADAMCVDVTTGRVVEIINSPAAKPLFVNTSIEQFTRTVKVLVDRFPYYGQEAPDYEIDQVADELQDLITRIDPEASLPDRYWSTFVDDARIGDLSTEAILTICE